jgi:hypothetical protein
VRAGEEGVSQVAQASVGCMMSSSRWRHVPDCAVIVLVLSRRVLLRSPLASVRTLRHRTFVWTRAPA